MCNFGLYEEPDEFVSSESVVVDGIDLDEIPISIECDSPDEAEVIVQ